MGIKKGTKMVRLSPKKKAVIKEFLESQIMDNPGNISACCRLASNKFKVNKYTVRTLYYKELRPNKALFIVKTPKGILVNTKSLGLAKEYKSRFESKDGFIRTDNLSREDKVLIFDLLLK